MGVYPPQQGDNYPVYPPLPPATENGGYHPLPAAGYRAYPPPPPPSQSSYPYPTYNVGPSAVPPSPSHYYTPQPAYAPPNNVGPLAAPPYHYMPSSPYPPYNVGISAAPPYAHPYPPHASHVQARAAPVEQRSVQKKKKSVWGSALGLAGAVAVGVLSGVAAPSLEIPPAPAPELSDLTGGFQLADPSAYGPQDLSFINTIPDPSALRDATYVDYSSLV